MSEFRITVDGPPGEADALLARLQATANRHGFIAEGRGSRDGALSGIDTIVAIVSAGTSIATLVWEIVKHKQQYAKASEPITGELRIHLHHGSKSLEVVDDDPDTIAEAERMRDDDGGDGFRTA